MDSDAFFSMVVQDIFTIAKRGTVVTGKVETGTLKVGDQITIKGQHAEKTTVVAGIEGFGKVLDRAVQGDAIGILLKDVARQDVERGDRIISGSSDFTWNP